MSNIPIVTAEKLLQYKQDYGHIGAFKAPETILVCYQSSTIRYLLKKYPEFQPSEAVTHLYVRENRRAGILGDWGVGAPGLSIKMEELVALGTKRFIAVGTAGGLMHSHQLADFVLCPQALAEDGVAHHYLPQSRSIAQADPEMIADWQEFAKKRSLPPFQSAMAWSFSALFRETVEDILRVHHLGCTVVEMEAATLYAIGQDKGVQTLSLFAVSDLIAQEWTPRVREPEVRNNLHLLADWALEFASEASEPAKTCDPAFLQTT